MIKEQSKHKQAPKVSFPRDIRPLFRPVDIEHMEVHGVELDDYTFMSDPENANKVLGTLSPHDDKPQLCHQADPIGPRTNWRCSPQWQKDGYQP